MSSHEGSLFGCDLQGERLPVVGSCKLRQGETKPPGYLTEAELIGMMESEGG